MSELATDFSLLDSLDVSRVVVGLSGGVDSVVLLDLVTRVTDLPVVALHIHHHLYKEADRTAEFCLSLTSRYPISVEVMDVDVSDNGSLETRAREARYAAFEKYLVSGDLLLLAHHSDDQAETVLFRLFRGSRVFGLEGMPFERAIGAARLCRPLLSVSREAVLTYARERQLEWREDPTNADLTPDRNFIRHELLPLINTRFPAARPSILAKLAGDERARTRLSEWWSAQVEGSRPKPNRLELNLFSEQSLDQICDLITLWLLDLDVPQPTGAFLENVANKIIEGQLVNEEFEDFSLNSFQDQLVLSPKIPAEMPRSTPLMGRVSVPGGYVVNDEFEGQGLRAGDNYEIRYRSGGEKLTIRLNRTLKNLFQENSVPPWLRGRLPLVYCGEQLVAVAGLPEWDVPMLVADDWQARSGEAGLEISLHLDNKIG